jgi:ABC-2 type transport system ATP-binding protein
MNIIESCGLGKRFGRAWALRDCTLAVPAGHVVALIGPNGAGKTTLLNLAVGLLRPTCGRMSVLSGEQPGSPQTRRRIGFVAQDAPLYGHLSVADMLLVARNMNLSWDHARARSRLVELAIPLDRKVRNLSSGQRAQLALTIAVAKRPEALILDEPLAALDPLARHDFMSSLMVTVAEDGLSVVLSSHVVSELERIADYLVVLNNGQLQIAGEVESLLASHQILTGRAGARFLDSHQVSVVHALEAEAQTHVLVRTLASECGVPGWQSQPARLEDLVLGYLRQPGARTLPGPAVAAAGDSPVVPA